MNRGKRQLILFQEAISIFVETELKVRYENKNAIKTQIKPKSKKKDFKVFANMLVTQ